MNRNLVIVLLLSTVQVPLYGISQQAADICTVLTSMVCAGGSYKVWYDMPAGQKVHPAILVGVSLITAGVAYSCFHSITPAGRLKRANILLNELYRHTLARVSFDTDSLFFDAVHDEYLREDLPLIAAYNHLINLLPDVHLAFGLINKAASEVGKDQSLQGEYNSSLSCANELFKNISMALKRVREHKDYLPQLALYKESLNNVKQTIAQEQIALAQVQMAQAQQSYTFLQWLKAIFQMR